MSILVTGGAGFIGSRLVQYLCEAHPEDEIVVVDALVEGSSKITIEEFARFANFTFVEGNICDAKLIGDLFTAKTISRVYHLAAESHVDRSLLNPLTFVQTNVLGTANLLHLAEQHFQSQDSTGNPFKFVHVSTDEVYGDLPLEGNERFVPERAYQPSSPYSASKAGSDHLATAWHRTYGLPCVITNCSNNFGPYQHPEKLIPKTIISCIEERPIPVYGKGENVRDWLFVEDHVRGLVAAHDRGRPGEKYLFGGDNEISNIVLVQLICDLVDEVRTPRSVASSRQLIEFVEDRLGHDLRYAVDFDKAQQELGWTPSKDFANDLKQTIHWYLEREDWWRPLLQ